MDLLVIVITLIVGVISAFIFIILLKRRSSYYQSTLKSPKQPKVAFVHPDLGIGGAERLIVDAAVGIQDRGCKVVVYTSHHDPTHCFPETLTKLKVQVHGDWLPRGIFGRMYLLCAITRNLYLIFRASGSYDVFIVDQISAGVPLLRFLNPKARILFYCHFPDQLLSARGSLIKDLYRAPLDFLEEVTTGLSHRIFVNSKFTAGVFRQTFPSIKEEPIVLYPPVSFEKFDGMKTAANTLNGDSDEPITFLSINRFERKKNLGLALRAYAELIRRQNSIKPFRQTFRLVIAGGYDNRVKENIEYLQELRALAANLELPDDSVIFKTSVSDEEKVSLILKSLCVLYTPTDEHFGIVPVEAMYLGRPVIACNSGGPLETVKNNLSGFLCAPDPLLFAAAMESLLQNVELARKMGRDARADVSKRFSLDGFSTSLLEIIQKEMKF